MAAVAAAPCRSPSCASGQARWPSPAAARRAPALTTAASVLASTVWRAAPATSPSGSATTSSRGAAAAAGRASRSSSRPPLEIRRAAQGPWTATESASWITLNTASGTGNGTATFTVAANPGLARNGTITVAGYSFAISQSSGCGLVGATPTTLPAGIVGSPYNQTINGTGGTASYSFALAVGSALPSGLSLASNVARPNVPRRKPRGRRPFRIRQSLASSSTRQHAHTLTSSGCCASKSGLDTCRSVQTAVPASTASKGSTDAYVPRSVRRAEANSVGRYRRRRSPGCWASWACARSSYPAEFQRRC